MRKLIWSLGVGLAWLHLVPGFSMIVMGFGSHKLEMVLAGFLMVGVYGIMVAAVHITPSESPHPSQRKHKKQKAPRKPTLVELWWKRKRLEEERRIAAMDEPPPAKEQEADTPAS